MAAKLEKGGGTFAGLKLLLCENPLPPIDEAITAARGELVRSNHYTEAHPDTYFLVDEAFIGLGGQSVVQLVPRHANLLVTRTLSKAHSLAGFRVGYAVLPEPLAEDLNENNDAYPLARPSQAAAIATLRHEEKILERAADLRRWAADLSARLQALGARTYPTETYFFLADFSPHDAIEIAERLQERKILVKPLDDARLGPGYMRVTTAIPEDNERFIEALQEIV